MNRKKVKNVYKIRDISVKKNMVKSKIKKNLADRNKSNPRSIERSKLN